MPLWRPFDSNATVSLLTAPSGFVLNDGEVDCAARRMHGGKGAGLNYFSIFF
jgi:hypothetical protein